MKFNVTKTNTMKSIVVNEEGKMRFIDATKDITDKDLASVQYRRLMEAHAEEIYHDPELERVAYISTFAGIFGSLMILGLFFTFAYLLLKYIA